MLPSPDVPAVSNVPQYACQGLKYAIYQHFAWPPAARPAESVKISGTDFGFAGGSMSR
jgi:hypothetical protein